MKKILRGIYISYAIYTCIMVCVIGCNRNNSVHSQTGELKQERSKAENINYATILLLRSDEYEKQAKTYLEKGDTAKYSIWFKISREYLKEADNLTSK